MSIARIATAGGLACLALASPLTAQTDGAPAAPFVGSDSVTIAADSTHKAGGIHMFLFGRHYRDLWTAPMRVPVLDLDRFDGGLRFKERGGGMQTKSMRFTSRNGREWVFRSTRKDARAILSPELRNSFMVDIVNDQTSHAHPGGAIVVPVLARALGVLHATPQFAVMPDHAALGEHREDFAGLLGQIELYPDDGEDGAAGFAGSEKVESSQDMFEELNDDPDVRVDAEALLTARLLDFMVNDWDRHKDNWRWARLERRGRDRYVPVPRDRDQVFFWADGLLPSIARMAGPKLVPMDGRIRLKGLTINGRDVDRTFLAPLDRAAWDSIARSVVARLDDDVIAAAERSLPASYQRLRPGELTTFLKQRREGLVDAALTYYATLARVVDIHATDKDDIASIEESAEGVEVVLRDGREDKERDVWFRRRFVPAETRELRVYLHGNDDSVSVKSSGPSGIVVRVIGGKGDNTLAGDSAAVRMYDFPRSPGEITYGVDTLLERRPQRIIRGDTVAPPPDIGGKMLPGGRFRYYSDLGFVMGVGVKLDSYGFRRIPYARRIDLRFEYASDPSDIAGQLEVDLQREGGGFHPLFRARASGFDLVRYYGQGNETDRGPNDGDPFRIENTRYGAELMMAGDVFRTRFELGPTLLFSRTSADADRPGTRPVGYGVGDFGVAGARARLHVDVIQSDADDIDRSAPSGVLLDGGGSVFPAIWDADEAFGEVNAELTARLRTSIPLSPTLAIRAGGQKIFGNYPFFASAFLGGAGNLRGFDEQRFAGDAMAYANSDLRLTLLRLRGTIPGDLGVFGLADVGRVWVDGETSDEWHNSFGGGFWFGLDREAGLVSVTIADGPERTGVYIEAGFGF